MEQQAVYEVEKRTGEVMESPLGRIVITDAQVDIIKNTVAIGATNEELKLFFYECRRRGVHPMDRLIHFIKRGQGDKAKATFQAGIDFLRGQAEETGEYRGQDDAEFGPIKEGTNFPEFAKVTVRRRDPETGEIYTISATAYWDEYYPGDGLGFIWRKMPRNQLAKCAEALALRKAFPKKIAGLYTFEEMEQAEIIETPKGKPPITPPTRASEKGATSPAQPQAGDGAKITDNQGKRFFAIASGAKKSKEEIESFLYAHTGSTHTGDIPKARYDEFCALVTTWKPGQAKAHDGGFGPESEMV